MSVRPFKTFNYLFHLIFGILFLITTTYNAIKEADVYIISVWDNAIAEVAENLPFQNRLVVHTSGTSELSVLDDKNRKGVFYPLQTFSKSKEIDFSSIPICLEAENEEDFKTLQSLSQNISEKVFAISSEQRKSLHVAAVFVCNFVNHMYTIGNQICEEHNVPFEVLQPLIMETAQKINTLKVLNFAITSFWMHPVNCHSQFLPTAFSAGSLLFLSSIFHYPYFLAFFHGHAIGQKHSSATF